MIKLILTGAWVCIVTLGTVYFSVVMATAPATDPDAEKKAALELVKGESITLPMISNGKVAGYFLSKISFMLDKEKMKGVELPMTEYLTDELFTLLVGNKMVDIADTSTFNVDEFRKGVKEGLNKRFGDEIVADVMVEQLDYLAKSDTRVSGGAENVKQPVKIVEGTTAETPTAAASESH